MPKSPPTTPNPSPCGCRTTSCPTMRFGRTSAGRRQREPGCFEHQIRSNKGFDVQDTRTKTDAYPPLHANKRHACLHAYIRTYHMHTYLHTNVQKHIRACTYLTTYIHRLHKYTYIHLFACIYLSIYVHMYLACRRDVLPNAEGEIEIRYH